MVCSSPGMFELGRSNYVRCVQVTLVGETWHLTFRIAFLNLYFCIFYNTVAFCSCSLASLIEKKTNKHQYISRDTACIAPPIFSNSQANTSEAQDLRKRCFSHS